MGSSSAISLNGGVVCGDSAGFDIALVGCEGEANILVIGSSLGSFGLGAPGESCLWWVSSFCGRFLVR